jgi:hypothetical protein
VNTVSSTGDGDGHASGQYAVESASRMRLPGANRCATWFSDDATT